MDKIVVVSFDVCGIARFPLDMLRHDACFPFDSKDVTKLEAMVSFDKNERAKCFDVQEGFARIRLSHLMRVDGSHLWYPTKERWLSFGWSIDTRNIQWSAWP